MEPGNFRGVSRRVRSLRRIERLAGNGQVTVAMAGESAARTRENRLTRRFHFVFELLVGRDGHAVARFVFGVAAVAEDVRDLNPVLCQK
jgi:hypothetical protein